MPIPAILPEVARLVWAERMRVCFILHPADQINQLIDFSRTLIVQLATNNGRNVSDAHRILEPVSGHTVYTQGRGRIDFFHAEPPIMSGAYARIVAPNLDGHHSYSILTHALWQEIKNRKPPEPPGPPPPSVWEWLRKPAV